MSGGKRVSLTDLAGDMATSLPSVSVAEPLKAEPEVVVEKPARSASGGGASSKLKSVPTRHGRIFDQFDRKEARVRSDQYRQLTDLSRGLNRSRNREGERITENTLIRVAIDMLLAKQSDLAGITEDELRRSVGL